MEKDQELKINENLNYLIIIFNHIDRVSILITKMDLSSSIERWGIALDINVSFLVNLLPDQLKDNQYYEEMSKEDSNKSIDKEDWYGTIRLSMRRFRVIVNLLNRKGILFSNSSVNKEFV